MRTNFLVLTGLLAAGFPSGTPEPAPATSPSVTVAADVEAVSVALHCDKCRTWWAITCMGIENWEGPCHEFELGGGEPLYQC